MSHAVTVTDSAALAPIGVTFASFMGDGLGPGLDAARIADRLGYSSFWTAEITGPEAFTTLAAVGAVAPSLGLATGVLAIQLRTPPLAAMGAASLQSVFPDREVILGLGISSPTVAAKWHGGTYSDRPLTQMREYLTVLRSCLSGETVNFEGDFYSISRYRLNVPLPGNRPKIIVGALNAKMLQLAGELADGVLLNYVPASLVPWSIEQVKIGQARRENDDPFTIYAHVHVGVCDHDAGLEQARQDLFFYSVVDAYARSFSRAGFADEIAEIHARHAARDRAGALAAVSDAMVDAIEIMGDADHVRKGIQEYLDNGVDVPVVMPLPWGADRAQIIEDTLTAAVGVV